MSTGNLNDQQRARVLELFGHASGLPPTERASFCARECAGDEPVRAELESLLRAEPADDDPFLAAPVLSGYAIPEPSQNGLLDGTVGLAPDPEQIGPYRIAERLGLGGMGIVYLAEQDTPRRRVALKVIHPLLTTPSALRRFRRESDVLGRLHHRGIAQVYEAGTFELGNGPQPYFAMELVEGLDLGSHAEAKKLDVRERLALIADLSDAVHHAHGKGIVHRDLKPDNVLVDGDGQVKVLDFGVAHTSETSSLLTSKMTQEGQLIGTLAYMPPEQLSGRSHEVTPRSDIYAIGVIAYELVAGELPHQLAGLSSPAAIRVLSEHVAPLLGRHHPSLRGDVETIVAKALEPDPKRRYATAEELAADIRRYLAHRPIAARPLSRYYQVSRLLRRNRSLASGLAATIAVLALGLAVAVRLSLSLSAEVESVKRLSALQDYDELIAAADELWPPHPDLIAAYQDWIEKSEALLQELPEHRVKLAELRKLSEPMSPTLPGSIQGEAAEQTAPRKELQDWTFPETEAGREARWWHANLSKLVTSLDGLQDEKEGLLSPAADAVSTARGWSIRRRLAFAQRMRDRMAPGEDWHARWGKAQEAIRLHPRYGELNLAPQAGLVPIGPDPTTGLWEFWHVATGDEPERGDDDTLKLTEEMGVVLVLIPAETFWMGASADPETEHNYDPAGRAFEGPVHQVSLSAHFFSKYEFTQGQWSRFTGINPSAYAKGTPTDVGFAPTMLNPVTQTTWDECMQELRRMDLVLPSEAQWEHGCRAGTETPWWTGATRETLIEFNAINLADQSAVRADRKWLAADDWPELDDGHVVYAPIGTFAPNPFGLHEVHGNVWEMCLDGLAEGFGFPSAKVDPVAPSDGVTHCMYRGGSFLTTSAFSRAGSRFASPRMRAYNDLGFRPARAISR